MNTAVAPDQLAAALAALSGADRAARLSAIRLLQDAGDETALAALRARLRLVTEEQQALILAVGILRWRLANEDGAGETWRLHDV